MSRNIERLPKRIFLFVALLLISACLLISLLPKAAIDPVQSAKSVLHTIPLYPGATQIYRDDTDTPGSRLSHQRTNCSIECARLTYEVPDRPEDVVRFYERWASTKHWRGFPNPGENAFARSYGSGPNEFKEFRPSRILGVPIWFYARYEPRTDHVVGIVADGKIRGITSIEVIIGRLAPMPSDTPIPTLPPPPPTAVIPIAPGSVMTAQPLVPAPLPTAP